MLPIFCFVVLLWSGFLFFDRQFLLQVMNDLQWKSIILGYCEYDLPFLFLACFVTGSLNILFI